MYNSRNKSYNCSAMPIQVAVHLRSEQLLHFGVAGQKVGYRRNVTLWLKVRVY